jgi:orotidine-5'-phosphate decarboxylase
MPALNGQIISTLYDAQGNVVIQVTENYDPATNNLRDIAINTSNGTKTGAIVVDNTTAHGIDVVVTNAQRNRTFTIPPKGAAITAAQLAALTPSITTISQIDGLSISLR